MISDAPPARSEAFDNGVHFCIKPGWRCFFFFRLLDGVVREKQARWPFWFERISLPWRYCSCPWLIISLRCRYRSSCGMWCDKALEKCQLLTSPSPRPMWASANRNGIRLGIRSIQHSTSSFAVFFHIGEKILDHTTVRPVGSRESRVKTIYHLMGLIS